ncbi:EH domain binding protein epsin 2 [Cladophialophora carrionii]|uniref:EH domain binding protein epsin 2 n=1 Tax=Cladophialophora carrionii TaxID=86049 RepID=A0A1C1CXM2_9EURO|nr:EH domain binding protein epsin 2 [Cladophialophora carrionii]
MPVTELARLSLQSGTEASSPALLTNLAKAKEAMMEASGFEFWYYHCVEDPRIIFILGAWPSVEFHMQEFIPSQPNQELLALLKDQLTVDWMFHLDIDQVTHPLPLSRDMVAIVRHFMKDGDKEAFRSTFEAEKYQLESFVGQARALGGWRIDIGYDPSAESGNRKEEFVLFTAWDSVEHHDQFANTEGFQKYRQIRNNIDGAEIKHAKLLDVARRQWSVAREKEESDRAWVTWTASPPPPQAFLLPFLYQRRLRELSYPPVKLAFFASPLLYQNLPTVRRVTDRNGRSYSVTETPSRSFDVPPSRRRTVVGVSDELRSAQARVNRSQHSPENIYRGSLFETAPIYRKGGSMSKVVRNVKNITKGYSSVQVKVRNATSNDPWGPTGTDMAEIAALTFNNPSDFYEIMDMLDKRLNDKGKNWRHVLKSLKVLDYALHEGSELVVTWARKNIYIIKTLREFQYVDEDGRDVGQNVRTSAKELTSLILDEERLRSERSDRKLWKTRVTGIDEYAPQAISGPSQPQRRHTDRHADAHRDQEERDFEEAKRLSELDAQERARKERQGRNTDDNDPELLRAIQLSKEEADLRTRQLEDQNAASLFDDTPEPAPAQSQPTGYNQGYQQQPAVDWFGNPLQQQPQSTGFLNNQYAQPQQTGFQNGFTNGFQPSQPTGYDQFGQQPFLQQQSTIQPQQTAFQNNNPYGAQPSTDLFGGVQSPQQTALQPGTNNPWATQTQAADALKPLPTGSNNPFAQKTQQPSPSPFARPSTQPSLGTLYESQPTAQFTQPSLQNPITNYSAPQSPFQQQQKPVNPQHARLNALLASGEGQDTFGNTGDLRIPAQHTAPGTFVNSAGQGLDRLHASQTGTNPFFSSQATGFAQVPAQTGPAGGFGGGYGQQNSNPFGARPAGQQGGSLIDL